MGASEGQLWSDILWFSPEKKKKGFLKKTTYKKWNKKKASSSIETLFAENELEMEVRLQTLQT